MRNLYFFLFISLLMTQAFGTTSCQSDSSEILDRVNAMNTAFEKGDAKTIIDMTDPVLFELVGGKEKMLSVTKQAIDKMHQTGFMVEKSIVGKPTKTYMAGTKSVCFIPKELIMSIDGVRARSLGYLVAINKNANNSPWLFLDSAGFKKRPELLWKLIPGLPKNVKLPPNNTELIQPDSEENSLE